MRSWSWRLQPIVISKNTEYCSKYRNKNIDKIRQKDKERKKFEREYVKYCDKKKYEEKKRKDRERKRLAKKRNVEQIDQPSPAPTREETETEETKAPTSSFKHKATKHRSLRRTENVLPSSPRTKKEIVTSLAKYSVRIQLNKPKKSGRKPITLNDEEKNLL